ncbi:MAG: 4-hydroxy-tetrahydrodipicolinate synthase [Nostocoides sp.]
MPSPTSAFGRVASAMVTPMTADGSLDLPAAQRLATRLADHGHDGLVVSGTTGEAPTTTDAEKAALIRAVVEAVGDRVRITAGVGSNDTAHTLESARQAAAAGAHALLAVTPYYSRPPQAGVVAHFTALADATDLPVMLYDIPGRSGIPLALETLLELAQHPRIQAVKDAKADYWQASRVMAETDLLWFSGDDAVNLLHFANGATGFVGVTSQVAPGPYAAMLAAVDAGDFAEARRLHRSLAPLVDAVMNITQGAIMAKATLHTLGVLDTAYVRLPLVEATPEQRRAVEKALAEVGIA